jgi:hypothetical protein
LAGDCWQVRMCTQSCAQHIVAQQLLKLIHARGGLHEEKHTHIDCCVILVLHWCNIRNNTQCSVAMLLSSSSSSSMHKENCRVRSFHTHYGMVIGIT